MILVYSVLHLVPLLLRCPPALIGWWQEGGHRVIFRGKSQVDRSELADEEGDGMSV